jgi:hypothetical protein
MPTHRDTRAIAASTTVANVLTSTLWEFARVPTLVSIWGVQDGAAAATPLLATLFLGNATPMENLPVPTFTAGQGPNRQDHGLALNHLARPNDRIVYRLQNTDPANASNARTLFDFMPV